MKALLFAFLLVLTFLVVPALGAAELELYVVKSSPDRMAVQENEEVDFILYVKNAGDTPAVAAPVYLNITHANATTEFSCGNVNVGAFSIVDISCGNITATSNDTYILASAYVDSADSNPSDNFKNLTIVVQATSNIPPAVPETHWLIALFSAAAAALLLSRKKKA